MITKSRFKQLSQQGLLASVRVVPIPFSKQWCIDLVVRVPMEAGSTTDTVSKPTTTAADDNLCKFDSIDAVAAFLHEVGVSSFTVDMDDAVSFVQIDGKSVRVIEKTMQVWNDDPDEGVAAVRA